MKTKRLRLAIVLVMALAASAEAQVQTLEQRVAIMKMNQDIATIKDEITGMAALLTAMPKPIQGDDAEFMALRLEKFCFKWGAMPSRCRRFAKENPTDEHEAVLKFADALDSMIKESIETTIPTLRLMKQAQALMDSAGVEP